MNANITKKHMAQAVKILLVQLGQFCTLKVKLLHLCYAFSEYHVYSTCSGNHVK
jgi:hypothetical protein